MTSKGNQLPEYIEVAIPCSEQQKEILPEVLSHLGLESFMETERGICAYAVKGTFDPDEMREVLVSFGLYQFEMLEIAHQNWNLEWEKNFEPLAVGSEIYIRAPFHVPSKGYQTELVIQPQMSFGTGHHATTYLMLEAMTQIDIMGKEVLDAGCGTGILAVYAEKKGASRIVAYDNYDIAVHNARENLTLNQCEKSVVYQGIISELNLEKFDLVLANINRNVLLEEIPYYKKHLKSKGMLVLSGFYEEDQFKLKKKAEEAALKLVNCKVRNQWCLLSFEL